MFVTIEVNNCYECPYIDKNIHEPNLCILMKPEGRTYDVKPGSWYNWTTPSKGVPDWCLIKGECD